MIKMMMIFLAFLLLAAVHSLPSSSRHDWSDDISREKWFKYGKKRLESIISEQQINTVAKNIILFVGDGMGISTITGRIRKGQQLYTRMTKRPSQTWKTCHI
jgi:alkaline phosphatase